VDVFQLLIFLSRIKVNTITSCDKNGWKLR
jgi:hypothetical protein